MAQSTMSAEERRWCWIFSLLLILITSAPYLLAFQVQGEAWRFSGFLFGVDDGNSYIAKMLRGQQGDWLFRTPYTDAEQSGVLAFLPYLLLGKLAAGPALHTQMVVLFHLFRVLAIPLVVFASYRFIALYVVDVRWRRWGTLLATLGGGLGWALTLIGAGSLFDSLPLDFYSPETFGFLAIYGLPHLILARALLLFALIRYLDSAPGLRSALEAGVTLLMLSLIQPLSVLAAYAAIGAHQSALLLRAFLKKAPIERQWLRRALIVGACSAPLVLYFSVAFSTDPFLAAWTAQNRILSPHPLHYLFAYGLLIPALIPGVRKLLAREGPERWLPLAWAASLPILAYLPHNLQRRFPDGIWLALIVIAMSGLSDWAHSAGRRKAALALLVLSLPTSLLLLAGGLAVATTPSRPVFRPIEEVQAFQWLYEHGNDGDLVLTSFETGNALPAWAPLRVVIGHGPESVGMPEIEAEVEALYQFDARSAILAWLQDHRVRFVYYGPLERALREEKTQLFDDLEPAYQSQGYEIYDLANGGEKRTE